MKKIGALQFGLSFAGCFLGAGYVSGQELWQFFGRFGGKGFIGLVLAVFLLLIMAHFTVTINKRTGIEAVDGIVIPWEIPALRASVTVLETVFLFGVVIIMSAGVGALLEQLFSLPLWTGSLIFITVVSVISLLGFTGMVSAFSLTVPILAAVTLIFGAVSLFENGLSVAPVSADSSNPLMDSWLVAAVSFACYNIFGTIPILAPLGSTVKSRAHSLGGLILGASLLFLIAGSVLVSVSASPEYISAELPMLALASDKSRLLGYVYGALLLFAMFGTSLSSLVAFVNLASLKSKKIAARPVLFTVICAVAVFFGSLFGFGDLIGVIYPLFGYISSIFIVTVVIHFFKTKKKVQS